MKTLAKSIACLVLTVLLTVAASAQREWVGAYEFEEDGGRTTGGTAILVSHRLEIVETDDGLVGMLQSNGYQTSKDLVGKVKIEGARLLLYFDSYGENNVFEPYTPGDLLLTLERKTVKEKTELLTFWNKFQPAIAKNEKTGRVYFRKTE